MYVKITVLKERLANLERLGEYFVSREVGGGSRGDVLLGNARMDFRTSKDETHPAGVLREACPRTAWVERMRWTMKRGC